MNDVLNQGLRQTQKHHKEGTNTDAMYRSHHHYRTMMASSQLVLTVVGILLVYCTTCFTQKATRQCPDICICSVWVGQRHVSCLRQGSSNNTIDLTLVPESTTHLRIEGANVQHLDSLGKLQSLEFLGIKDSELPLLTADSFQGLVNLRTLRLENVGLTSLSREVLLPLRNLENLILKRNEIASFATNVFNHLRKLKVLVLACNALHNLPCGLWTGLSNTLDVLDLSRNLLEHIPQCSFRDLYKLSRLNLADNIISHIDPLAFANNTALQELLLSHNLLNETITNLFEGLRSLHSLDLAYNLYEKIPDKVLVHLKHLRKLVMSGNPLESLEQDCFDHLSELEELLLEGLDRNTTIHDGAFNGLNKLKRFVLQGPVKLPERLSTKGPQNSFLQRFADRKNLWRERHTECPSICSCSRKDGKVVVSCHSSSSQTDLDLAMIPGSAVYLRIERVTVHGQFSLKRLKSLEVLVFKDVNIRRLEVRSFTGLYRLRVLHVENTEIGPLRKGLFLKLRNLETLVLQRNNITSIELTAFIGLAKLKHLHLAQNDISQIDCRSLDGMRETLETLDLRGNSLADVHSCVFGKLENLQIINLASNQLTWVDGEIFCALSKLRELNLGLNKLARMHPRAFAGLEILSTLDLSDNQFTTVPSEHLTCLGQLQTLDLSGNPIQSLIAFTFESLNELEELHLNRMQELTKIQDGVFSGLEKLRLLELDACEKLSELPERLSLRDDLSSLQYLTAIGSALTTVEEKTFEHLAALKSVILKGNPIHCDCKLKWLKSPSERYLPLHKNGRQLQEKVWQTTLGLVCRSPLNLEGSSTDDLTTDDLSCDPPSIQPLGKPEQSLPVGTTFTLQAVMSHGAPESIWTTSQGTLLNPGDRVTNDKDQELYSVVENLTPEGDTISLLKISQFSADDSGKFKCTATNGNGVASVEFTVRVHSGKMKENSPNEDLSDTFETDVSGEDGTNKENNAQLVTLISLGVAMTLVAIVTGVTCTVKYGIPYMERKRNRREHMLLLETLQNYSYYGSRSSSLAM